jgi:hypothetical protein
VRPTVPVMAVGVPDGADNPAAPAAYEVVIVTAG